MLDVGGQDATEAFEDVGHSDEAREILNGMLVGDLKRAVGSITMSLSRTTMLTSRPPPARGDAGENLTGLPAKGRRRHQP